MSDNKNNNTNMQEELNSTLFDFHQTKATFETTTIKYADLVRRFITETLGIPEIDKVVFYPVFEKGQIVSFDCDLIFNTNNRNQGERNIWRVGTQKQSTKGSNGRINLMGAVGGRRSTGGSFETSNKFKQSLGAFLIFDDNDNIVIDDDGRDNSNVAVVPADAWAIFALSLNIRSDDAFDYDINVVKPLNNSSRCIDYEIELVKKIVPNYKGKRSRSGQNYDALIERRAARKRS